MVIIERREDIALFRQALLRLFHLLWLEELDLIFAFTTGGKGRREGAAIELFRCQIAIIHRQANAGAWAQLNPLDGQPLIDDSEHLLT
ncbi:hypothetical protein D3C72_1813260 [compost metagenome]